DVLVNNAGVCPRDRDVVANLRRALDTNVLGAVAVTEYFKHLLRRSAAPRIVFVSSSMGSITHAADPHSGHYKAAGGAHVNEYRISKAALNMAMVQIAKTYAEGGDGLEDVKVFGADPGPNATNLHGPQRQQRARDMGLPMPDVGASVVADVVKGRHDDKVGRVVGAYGVSEW
ncbi:MAG: SDR family NAD(P)-dependent oxidoreductase, partial [Terriglobus roseus]|nr:SDR family NAD(P)-dependent oxidoreductase [Terriglobus roseus]